MTMISSHSIFFIKCPIVRDMNKFGTWNSLILHFNVSSILADELYWVVILSEALAHSRFQLTIFYPSDELLAEKMRYKNISDELDTTFAELAGY